MIKLLGKDGKVHEYLGEQCSQTRELKEYSGLFKVFYIWNGFDEWLIPIKNEAEGEQLARLRDSSGCIDLTYKTVYAHRCKEYCFGFQDIIDTWYIVGESELTKEKLFEFAKEYQPEGYSRVSIEECREDEMGSFEIIFHKKMKERQMREELKEMGFILKRHKDSNGENMYMILKADDNSVYVGENYSMNEVDVDRFINE